VLSYGRERSVILEAVAHDKHCVLANALAAHFASSSAYLDAARSHLDHATLYEKLVFYVISCLMSKDRDDDVAVELHSLHSKTQSPQPNLRLTPQVTTSTNDTWTAPQEGWYKVNSDVALAESDSWGVGIIIRDFEGFVLAAATRRFALHNDATVAELMEIRVAIKFALELSFQDVIFESDCNDAVEIISSKAKLSSYLGLIANDCILLVTTFILLKFFILVELVICQHTI
ncbi:Reverse transcriptase-like, partial [Sesbania bispinosa]